METAQKVLQSMYDKLDNFLKTETVIGETIVVDDIKLIPIITA
ncbi:MAG: sporulation protein, partial [Halanaerobium sp. MSAO_Bac5]